jgi:transcriptional regulator with XRE-family HTH domain
MSTDLHQVAAPPARAARPGALADPQDLVRYFRTGLGLTEAELHQAVGADERTIRRWASDADAPAPQRRHAERIDDLRDLSELLGETLLDEHIGRWLRVRNRLLGGGRPLELLAQGNYNSVREAAEAFVSGDPI